jgi:leucyl aminopeptidase
VAACEEGPDAVVDIATLTGAQMVALGARTFGIMGDEALRTAVAEAARGAGEDGWPMPLPEHLRPSLDSKVADLKNIGDKNGGMLVAAIFLREFVGGGDGARVPWAHVDIAGPSFNEGSPYGYTPAEGTGAGVRTLVRLLEDAVADRG